MSSADYDWDEIETEIQAVYPSLPTHKQSSVIPGAYQAQKWTYTTHSSQKRPCACCGKIPAEMVALTATINFSGIDPVCLCVPHFREWKSDPRTKNRLFEEQEKYQKRIQSSCVGKRPRNPQGWQIDAEETVHELNNMVSGLAFDVPVISSLPDHESLERLRDLNKIKPLLQSAIDQAKHLLMVRGMKRPENSAYNPEEVNNPESTAD